MALERGTGETRVTLTVKNSGKRDGETVVQLYAGSADARDDRPVKLLKGFLRVALSSGEEKTVTLCVPDSELMFYDSAKKEWALDKKTPSSPARTAKKPTSFKKTIKYKINIGGSIMKKKINVAVIGCGASQTRHTFPRYMGCKTQASSIFCDIIPERADNAVKKYGCGEAVYDYKKILDDPELDAVSVCTHNDLHSVISIDFMRHGKDVLCEKPAARVLNEALKMEKVSLETGRLLSIGVCNRYNNSVNHIKRLIAEGELGNVYHVYASFAHTVQSRARRCVHLKRGVCGGSLIDWGVHYLDLILYCSTNPSPSPQAAEAFCVLGKKPSEYVYTGCGRRIQKISRAI